jgi:acyl carrier protein
MKQNVIGLVADVLNVAPADLTLQSGPANLGQWDSLAHVTIMAAVEQTYSIEFTMREMLAIKSIADLQKTLETHGISCNNQDR